MTEKDIDRIEKGLKELENKFDKRNLEIKDELQKLYDSIQASVDKINERLLVIYNLDKAYNIHLTDCKGFKENIQKDVKELQMRFSNYEKIINPYELDKAIEKKIEEYDNEKWKAISKTEKIFDLIIKIMPYVLLVGYMIAKQLKLI